MDILMPRFSSSMEEGTIAAWLRADGDVVSRGEDIAEIETDKATMPLQAEADGVLRVLAGAGETRAVGEPIASIGDTAGAVAPLAAVAVACAAVGNGTEGAGTAPARPARRRGPAASPVARKLAAEHGIELAELAAVAGGRRIVREDVEAAIAARRTAPAERAAEPAPPEATADLPPAGAATGPAAAPTGEARVVALGSVERLIARRMTETKATVPEFTIRMTADMSACLEFRQRLRAERRRAPSLNDMIVKACGLALSRHPRVNGSYRDGEIALHGRVNVGIAVAGEGTLLVPTIFDADSRPLADIARESVRLVESARAGTITPPELDGGTFTISNLGMFGVEEFSAIINAPQAAILAVGAVRRADGGASMTMTLTCDHRILYGADAAAFLGDVRRYLEEPLTMLL